MILVGIDPGKKGALFVLPTNDECAPAAYTIPLLTIKGKERPDYSAMARAWCSALLLADHVFIEQVGAMPGQGVASMFNFGYVAGVAYGLVLAANLPVTFVTPQRWKKIVGLSGSDGEESRRRAGQLLPRCVDFWPRKKDDGVAEAALIAYAGQTILNGDTNGKAIGCGPDLSAASGNGENSNSGSSRTRDIGSGAEVKSRRRKSKGADRRDADQRPARRSKE